MATILKRFVGSCYSFLQNMYFVNTIELQTEFPFNANYRLTNDYLRTQNVG